MRLVPFFVFDEVINILDTTFANAEARIGVENRHISTALDFYSPPANATMITIECHLRITPLSINKKLAIKNYRAYNTPCAVFASTAFQRRFKA